MNEPKEPKLTTTTKVVGQDEKPKFDDIQTTQQAINMAVAEQRVVRYITNKTREEILGQIDDKKGCSLRKPDKDSMEVAIIPEGIEDFSFDEVDTKIYVPHPRKKSSLIWTP